MHHHFILIVQLGADRNCWGYAGSPKPFMAIMIVLLPFMILSVLKQWRCFKDILPSARLAE
jgi:hypothetical protein